MAGNLLVLVEASEGEVDGSSIEILGRAREVADSLGVKLFALLLGYEVAKEAELVSKMSVDEVFLADHPLLKYYNPDAYSRVIVDQIESLKPYLFLLGYTHAGMELGPTVASRIQVPLVSNCVDIKVTDGSLQLIRTLYFGKVNAKIDTEAESLVVSVQKGALPLKELTGEPAKITRIEVHIEDKEIRAKVAEMIQSVAGAVDLTRADIIVSGGRGLREAKNLQLIRDLAEAMGGVIACSRPLVDFEWLPPEYQIGMSGKTVRPKLYVAVGISGSPQHVMGMKGSKTIIAINKDPSAPIFRIADYGIVADLFQVVPALIEEANKLKGKH